MSPQDRQRLFLRWGYFTPQELKTIKRMLRDGPAWIETTRTRWDLYEELTQWEECLAAESAVKS